MPIWIGCTIIALVYAASIVLMLPGTPMNLACGFLFHVMPGSLVALAAACLGSTVAFLLGRTILSDWASDLIKRKKKLRAIDLAINRQGFVLIFLMRLSPLFPYSLLNYTLGVTKVSFLKYFIATNLGNMPASVAYTYFGSLMRDITAIWSSSSSSSEPGQDGSGDVSSGGFDSWFFATAIIATTVFALVLVTIITGNAIKSAMRELDRQQELQTLRILDEDDIERNVFDDLSFVGPFGMRSHQTAVGNSRRQQQQQQQQEQQLL